MPLRSPTAPSTGRVTVPATAVFERPATGPQPSVCTGEPPWRTGRRERAARTAQLGGGAGPDRDARPLPASVRCGATTETEAAGQRRRDRDRVGSKPAAGTSSGTAPPPTARTAARPEPSGPPASRQREFVACCSGAGPRRVRRVRPCGETAATRLVPRVKVEGPVWTCGAGTAAARGSSPPRRCKTRPVRKRCSSLRPAPGNDKFSSRTRRRRTRGGCRHPSKPPTHERGDDP